MAKKAQTTIGQIITGIFLFGILMLGASSLFFGYLAENDVDLSGAVNQTAFETTFGGQDTAGNFQKNLSALSDSAESERESILESLPGWDFFASGINSIKAGWKTIGFMREYAAFAQKNTILSSFLPSPFWLTVGSIFTITIILVVLGALWRYPLTK